MNGSSYIHHPFHFDGIGQRYDINGSSGGGSSNEKRAAEHPQFHQFNGSHHHHHHVNASSTTTTNNSTNNNQYLDHYNQRSGTTNHSTNNLNNNNNNNVYNTSVMEHLSGNNSSSSGNGASRFSTFMSSLAAARHRQNQNEQAIANLFGLRTSTASGNSMTAATSTANQPSHSILMPSEAAAAMALDPLFFQGRQPSQPTANTEQERTQQHQRHQPSFDDFLQLASAGSFPMMTADSSSLALGDMGSATTSVPTMTNVTAPFSAPDSSEKWLDEMKLTVPSISLTELSGTEVVRRVQERMDDVMTRYIPCVNFLVYCQQELRKGLAQINQQRSSSRRHKGPSARQFFHAYVDSLPRKFLTDNQFTMESDALTKAFDGLQQLRSDAKNNESQGCEAVKSSFLGGMKDGESWGLRKWLSKHGNALRICTDLECILNACQKLNRDAEATKKLSDILRPQSSKTLNRLKHDIPTSYQEHSSAHPYLPFFHRLESALRSLANFNPDDDGVICIDDDDDDDAVEPVKAPAKPVETKSSRKRKAETMEVAAAASASHSNPKKSCAKSTSNARTSPSSTAAAAAIALGRSLDRQDDSSSSGDSDSESVVQIVDVVKPAADDMEMKKMNDFDLSEGDWTCEVCCAINMADSTACLSCGELNFSLSHSSRNKKLSAVETLAKMNETDLARGGQAAEETAAAVKQWSDQAALAIENFWAVPDGQRQEALEAAFRMAGNLDQLAAMFEDNQQSAVRPSDAPHSEFWDGGRYGRALRLLSSLLRQPESPYFVDHIDEDRLIQAGNPPYSHVIKHPLCFRDIVSALIQLKQQNKQPVAEDGRLPARGLSKWNMWKGTDFLQAIDLVLLNSLAYGKAIDEGKSQHRAMTNKLRKDLWKGINSIVAQLGSNSDQRKQCTPTRRSETSGFVVYKIQER